MTLPTDLPADLPGDLQHEVAERTAQPGFDTVLDRAAASRRRRRTTIASGLAAAVVVGGLGAAAGGLVGSDDGSPDPARPAPTTPWDGSSAPDERLPSSVRAVLDDDRLQLWAVTGAPDGGMAALWRGCDFDPCQFAVVTRDGDEVSGEVLGASFPLLSTVPEGWLVEDAGGATRLSPSGDRTEIFDTGPGSGDVMAGDTAVDTSQGWRLLRGDKLIPLPAPSWATTVVGAYVTEGGRLILAGTTGTGVTVSATDDGRTWDGDLAPRVTAPVGTAVVAGSGEHVAVVLLGDGADGSIPVVDVLLSHDAGGSWSMAVDLDTEGGDRVRDMSSAAVTPDGTTYLATGSHHLVRIDDQGFAVPTQLSAFDTSVFAAGDQVCLVGERGRYDALLCSPDGITEWADQPLPGLG
jgi:hypothetical protein